MVRGKGDSPIFVDHGCGPTYRSVPVPAKIGTVPASVKGDSPIFVDHGCVTNLRSVPVPAKSGTVPTVRNQAVDMSAAERRANARLRIAAIYAAHDAVFKRMEMGADDGLLADEDGPIDALFGAGSGRFRNVISRVPGVNAWAT